MADETNLADDAGADLSNDNNEQRQLSEVEQLAAEMGWKPDAEGIPEEKRKTAAEWLKAGRDIERNLRQDVRSMREQMDRMAEASTKQAERMLKRQADELEARYKQALADNDAKAVDAVHREMRELQAEAINAAPQKNVEQDFASRNPWYGQDEEATAYAVAISQREASKGKGHAEQLAVVESSVRKRFPELFGDAAAPAPKAPAAVNAPGRAAPVKREKGFSDLPANVKVAFEKNAKLFYEKFGEKPEDTIAELTRDYWAERTA